MPEKGAGRIIYHRAKADAIGAVVIGFILIAFAIYVMTQEGFGGIPFSQDLRVMSIYLGLPLGVALIIGHSLHALAKGPTMVAGKEGVTVLYTPVPAGPIPWAEIKAFVPFRSNGQACLGIVLEDPDYTLTILQKELAPLRRIARGKRAHLGVRGKMLDAPMPVVIRDLNELHQVHSWHRP
jgi:hypothetical protein